MPSHASIRLKVCVCLLDKSSLCGCPAGVLRTAADCDPCLGDWGSRVQISALRPSNQTLSMVECGARRAARSTPHVSSATL